MDGVLGPIHSTGRPPMYRYTMGTSVQEPTKPLVLRVRAPGPQLVPGLSTPDHFAFMIVIIYTATMLPSGIASTVMYI